MLLLLLVIVSSGGLYLLIQNGTLSQHQLLNMVGMGTGEISVANLSDDKLLITLTPLDGKGDNSILARQRTMRSMELQDFAAVQPGRYQLTVPRPAAQGGGDCLLKIESGDLYNLVVVRTGAVITRQKEPATDKSDLGFTTSVLCKR